MLLSIWQHVNLRLKLLHLLRLCRCARVRQSVLVPAAFAYDEAHIRNTCLDVQNVGDSIAAIRVPSFLAHIRSLAVTVTLDRYTFGYSSPHFLRATLSDQSTLSSASAQPADEKESAEKDSDSGRQPKRPKLASIGLASLTHMQTLVLDVRCHCANKPAYGQENKEREPSDVALPYLPALETLVLEGEISKHCLSLLLSCTTQFPRLSSISLEDFRYQHYGPPVANSPPFTPELRPFMSWLASLSHIVCLEGEMERCYLSLKQPPVAAAGDEAVEYVRIGHPRHSRQEGWQTSAILSPFRFLSRSAADASLSSATAASLASPWSAIRVLDCSHAALPATVELMKLLPPLPSLQYVLPPTFAAEQWGEPLDADDVFRWLNSCPQLTTCDNITFTELWPDTCALLLASELPSRLVSLQLLDAPSYDDSILELEGCLFRCFPSSAKRSSFRALRYLQLPLGVTESGRLAFPLSRLRHLPALHSLLCDVHIVPKSAVEEAEEDEVWWTKKEAKCRGRESALAQLSSISTLRWIAIRGGEYPWEEEEGFRTVKESTGLAFCAALFGWHAASFNGLGDRISAAQPRLHVEFLTVHLSLSSFSFHCSCLYCSPQLHSVDFLLFAL